MNYKIIGALVLTIVVVLLLWRNQYLGDENDRLQKELDTANLSIEVLDETKRKFEQLQQEKQIAIDQIDKAPKTDDGDIAPILRNTLGRM